ncbi:hypothetical protein BT63DRAFT_184743 [Microthyrium microscopicum]|uniref:Uncharacterized protein n=1 Tax=Microthyrium microscopicum TaxID=703497 RepID=A0A6A6UJS9_9PEZI|nr:hypothetical protein BT63DRAFT_184743 [Microthyrium microscopicum]
MLSAALKRNSSGDRNEKVSIATPLLRVNRMIHDEFADALYGRPTFEVIIANELGGRTSITLASKKQFASASNTVSSIMRSRGNDPTYQMMISRQQQMVISYGHNHNARLKAPPSGIQNDFRPWQPLLAMHYFTRIRSFKINIKFDQPGEGFTAPLSDAEREEEVMAEAQRNLLCDYIHRMVDCLNDNSDMPLRKIDVDIRMTNALPIASGGPAANNSTSTAIHYGKALLNPLRRLSARSVGSVAIMRSTRIGDNEVNLSTNLPLSEKDMLQACLMSFREEVTDSQPRIRPAILIGYAQLSELVSQMSLHPFWRDSDVEDMEHFLNTGRAAREAGDLKELLKVYITLFDKLNQRHDEHNNFMDEMKHTIRHMQNFRQL